MYVRYICISSRAIYIYTLRCKEQSANLIVERMGDSEEDNEKDFACGLNITGFLFGNIDDNGQLEDDILDPEAKQHLASLGRLGLSSFINEMMPANECTAEERGSNEANDRTEDQNAVITDKDADYLAKSPTALDFSDINELADDTNDEAR